MGAQKGAGTRMAAGVRAFEWRLDGARSRVNAAAMKALHIIAVLAMSAVLCLPGCSTPGAAYAREHPELSPVHRQILVTGRIPGGVAAEGMTKEQVKAAVGNPRQREPVDGGEVWIFMHERSLDVSPRDDAGVAFGSGPDRQRNFTETASLGPRPAVIEKARVFFRGDRVAQVQITQE